MEEIWKKIELNELYEVSNLGRVRSFSPRGRSLKPSKEPRVLSSCVGKSGYCFVKISGKNMMVHRLVAMAFIDMEGDKTVVNHKNGIKTDNTVNNLEWCTQADNIKHARRVLEKGHRGITVKEDRILCVETGEKFRTTREASEKTGVDRRNITKAIKGHRKTAGGFRWKWLLP